MLLLPPTARTLYGLDLAQHAGLGLTLLVCDSCDGVIYPHRELCSRCLGDALNWRIVGSSGTVLAETTLARSFDEWFAARLPWMLVSVHLQVGVTLICHAHPDIRICKNEKAAEVSVQVCLDAGGSGILVAMPKTVLEKKFETLDAALKWRVA